MTILITKPEVEALINQRLQTGRFKDAEDVVLQALSASVIAANGSDRATIRAADERHHGTFCAPAGP